MQGFVKHFTFDFFNITFDLYLDRKTPIRNISKKINTNGLRIMDPVKRHSINYRLKKLKKLADRYSSQIYNA